MRKLNLLLLALLLMPAFSFAQTIAVRDIIAKINRGEAVSYQNARIEGDLDLTQLNNKRLKKDQDNDNENNSKFYISTVTAPVSFTGCTFTGKVLGYFNPNANQNNWTNAVNDVFNTNFEKEVTFEKCIFEKEVAFKYSEFKAPVSFAGSQFQDLTIFKYTKFERGPDFSKTAFQGETVFKYVKFPKSTSFAGAAFRGHTDFKYAEFLQGGNFARASFAHSVDFKYTKLADPVSFEGTVFKGAQDFKYTELNGRKVNLAQLAAK